MSDLVRDCPSTIFLEVCWRCYLLYSFGEAGTLEVLYFVWFEKKKKKGSGGAGTRECSVDMRGKKYSVPGGEYISHSSIHDQAPRHRSTLSGEPVSTDVSTLHRGLLTLIRSIREEDSACAAGCSPSTGFIFKEVIDSCFPHAGGR